MSTYYERNKERLKALAKKYRETHLEKCKAYAAAYFQQVTKSKRKIIGRKMNKPKSEPAKDYTIKTTIKYKEPVPKIPKTPKVRKPAAPKPVIERSGVLTFD
jgi:hypothetical protein